MRKEDLSSFMDDALVNAEDFISTLSGDKAMQNCWHRYHIARQAMQNKLPPFLMPESVSIGVLNAIEDLAIDQPLPHEIEQKRFLFSFKFTSFFTKITQLGIAAGVALAVIVSVQYANNKDVPSGEAPSFNTIPIGVNLSPVGGLNPVMSSPDEGLPTHKIGKKEYEKIYFLLQEHELQKRLNAVE